MEQVSFFFFFNFMVAVTSTEIWEPRKIESDTVSTSPLLFAMNWCDWCHDLSFLNVEFEARFFILLFHNNQEAYSSSSLSDIRVVSSAYLRLLVFLAAILISTFVSSSVGFYMMYSACKLNKQVSIYSLDIILFQFGTIPYLVLTTAS